MTKKKIPEDRYRASRICRVLGNPTAYETLQILKSGPKTPEELAKMLGVHIATISHVLKNLRNLDLVRYEVEFRRHIYWIKDDRILRLMKDLAEIVKRIRVKEY